MMIMLFTSSRSTAVWAALIAASICLPLAARGVDARTIVSKPAPHRTIFEHQDHRMLPIGTRIYYGNADRTGQEVIVYPNQPVPATFEGRPPDIMVVGPYDKRADVVIERTKPQQACCGAHYFSAR